ncbi:hypothetical protein [Plantactinospora endophytica]|nr:hypothetical protein [Plantactinospora endophytica]
MAQPDGEAADAERNRPPGVRDDAVPGVPDDAVPVVADGSGRRTRRWPLVAAVVLLAGAAALLGGLYLEADRDRQDQRRRVAELTSREAELVRQEADSRHRAAEAQRQFDAERARFTAVEPCLRQVTSPAPIELLPEADRDRILDEAMRNPPSRSGRTVRLDELTLPRAIFPACEDVARQLK